jgi:hypothetical protein
MAGLAAILVPSTLPAQITFQRTYGTEDEETGLSVMQTSDGGFVVAADASLGGGFSYHWFIRTDDQGDTLWTQTCVYGLASEMYSCTQTSDGGFVVVGATHPAGGGALDAYLIRFDAEGGLRWAQEYGGSKDELGCSVQQTSDGGYIVVGSTDSRPGGVDGVYLFKTGPNGDTVWTRVFSGAHKAYGRSVKQTSDSGYVIAGYTMEGSPETADILLARTNADGDTLWTRTYGGPSWESGECVEITADGGYVIAGTTCSFGAGADDVYLIKTDANGDTLWTRTYGGADHDQGFAVRQTSDGGYVVVGGTFSFGMGDGDVYLVKTDADGDVVWSRTFGDVYQEYGYDVLQTGDGGYAITGETWSYGAGRSDVYLIKTDSLGSVDAVEEPKTSPTRAPSLSLTCEPNPFRSSTVLHLTTGPLDHSTTLLRIYDAQGRAVRSFSSLLSPHSSLTWDGTDDFGKPLPSGAYFLRVDAGNRHATARLVLQR